MHMWAWVGCAGVPEEKPDATFSFVDGDFVSVAGGKMNPQMAFIRCKQHTYVLIRLMINAENNDLSPSEDRVDGMASLLFGDKSLLFSHTPH